MDGIFNIGERITANYIAQTKLGSGGFGSVYKVLNEFTEEVGALKVFDAESSTHEVLHEFKIMREMHHDHIARVVDAGRLADGRAYILSEYAGDENLTAYTKPDKLLPLKDVKSIGEQVLNALIYMHQSKERLDALLSKGTLTTQEYNEFKHKSAWGIYHRDIKPANIVISSTSSGLMVKLVDFNASVSQRVDAGADLRTPSYYPADGEDLERGDLHSANANLDLFALGVVLYELSVGHHPYERNTSSGGSSRVPNFDAPIDASKWQSRLPKLWQSFLAHACAPFADERFATAQEMLEALKALPVALDLANIIATNRAALITISVEEASQPNYNPYVTRFLTMYSQAKGGNKGTRSGPSEQIDKESRQDELTAATYVPTRLDSKLLEDILAARYRLVVITGNAGDGKTAFIRNLEATCQQRGCQITDEGGNGSRFIYHGYSFHTNYDGSQDEQGQNNTSVLRRFFSLFAGDERDVNKITDKATGKVFVIAINEGRLREFFSREQEQESGRFGAMHRLIEYFFSGEVMMPSDILFVNLNSRSLVAEDVQAHSDSIFDRQLEALLDPSFWQPCESCALKQRCYIKFNADSLRDPGVGLQVRERLHHLLDIVHLRRKLHITMRDLRSVLSYVICADNSCADVASMLQSLDQESDPNQRLNKLLSYAANFYYNTTERHSADRLVEQLGAVDVAEVANPAVDRAIYFEGEPQGALEFSRRSTIDRDIYEESRTRLRESGGNYTLVRRLHRQLRRKSYFELKSVEALQMAPYRYIEVFQQALRRMDKPTDEDSENLLRQLLRGLSLATGEDNVKVVLPDDSALYLRAVAAKARPSIFSYRRLAADRFSMRPAHLEAQEQDYIEYQPDRMVVEYAKSNKTANPVLELTLDLFENLLHINDGYVPSSDEVQGALINLSIFKNTLGRLPYHELLLLDGTSRYTITKDEGLLTLSKLED